MNFKFVITIIAFILIFLPAQTAFAACPAAGTPVLLSDPKIKNHQYTGTDCSGLGAAQTNDNLRCIGRTGCRYWVFYCDSANTCMIKYDEQSCSNAPALCNQPDSGEVTEISKIFGKIDAPQAIHNFGFGGAGISKLLSNIIALFYSLAIIVLIFMIMWGAWDWLTSEGDKEKLSSAQKKIVNALIGILLFAVAFAIIQIMGTFTGFQFFVGQK